MAGKARTVVKAKAPGAYAFEGHIEFYGYHAPAEGWFLSGWVAHPWPEGHRPGRAVATFTDGQADRNERTLFYRRDDPAPGGIGYVFFLRGSATLGALRSLRLKAGDAAFTILPGKALRPLAESELVEAVQACLSGGGDQSWHDLLAGRRAVALPAASHIDFYGYHTLAGGWMFCGWTRPEAALPKRVLVSFEAGDISGEAISTRYQREDVPEGATGLIFFIPSAEANLGPLCTVGYQADGRRMSLFPSAATSRLGETHLQAMLAPTLNAIPVGAGRERLVALLDRRRFAGAHTLGSLSVTVVLEIDEAIYCGADGLLLMGWMLAKPGDVVAVHVRSGARKSRLDFTRCLWVDRPDVLEGFAAQGFTDPRCGFLAFLPSCIAPGETAYLQVETKNGEWGYRPLPPARYTGLAAIKRVLAGVDVRFTEVQAAFDNVLGPAVAALNASRLTTRPAITLVDYGAVPPAPAFSVIVPLHGRLDFVEYQMALLSADPGCAAVEFIYVLDDPPKRREAQYIFTAVYERTQVAFRTLLLDCNMGFAPACNIGLQRARAPIVAFLNSDVFPGTPDWLARLGERLAADPQLGIVAPWLLFEDGSVQHRGMTFGRLPEFANWHFGQHIGKGQHAPIRPARSGVQRCLSLTGACMVMARALAEQVGGFDEVYAVGDFEDSDMCFNVARLGYACAVDPEVRLYHLERQSQAGDGSHWRQNLTVYNAWQHERRWGKQIAELQEAARAR